MHLLPVELPLLLPRLLLLPLLPLLQLPLLLPRLLLLPLLPLLQLPLLAVRLPVVLLLSHLPPQFLPLQPLAQHWCQIRWSSY